jgi:hypothetical protein
MWAAQSASRRCFLFAAKPEDRPHRAALFDDSSHEGDEGIKLADVDREGWRTGRARSQCQGR